MMRILPATWQIDFYVHEMKRDEKLNLGRSQKSSCQVVKAQERPRGTQSLLSIRNKYSFAFL